MTSLSTHPHATVDPKGRISFLLLLFVCLAIPAHGSPEQEAARRQADIEKQLADLKIRNQRQLSDSTRQQFQRKLRGISAEKGKIDVFPGVFRIADINRVVGNEGLEGEGASLEGLRLFHRQLAGRGIDLIVLPVVSQVVLHGHKLLPGEIKPGDDIWPAYTQILIDLLEDGIEVIDVRTAFEEHLAKNPEDDPLNLFDHHWASTGKNIGARLAAERLQRYDFIRKAASGKSRFSEEQVSVPTPLTYLKTNEIPQDRESSLNIPETITQTQILYNGAPLDTTDGLRDRIDPLLILGDSQALDRPGKIVGTNFAEHLSREVGFPVPHRAENGGANFMPRRYAERWIREPKQPRVIVMAMVMDQLLREWAAIPFPDAKGKTVEASAKFVGTDDTTLGDWKGKYGAEGCFIVGQEPQLPPALLLNGSPQVLPTINEPGSQVYKDEESDLHANPTTFPKGIQGPNCLLLPSTGANQRSTSVWRNHITKTFGVDVNFQDENEHQVALYVAALAKVGGWTTIEVQNADPANRKTLLPAERVEYGDKGVYAIFRVKGRVRFLFKDGYPTLAGLFFDVPPGVARSTASSAPTPGPASAPKPLTPATAAVPAKFTTVGTIEFVSVLPNPKTSPYADALTTVVVQAGQPFPGTDKTRAYVIGWAFKNRALLYASKIRQGQKWQLTLADWNQILQQHPVLESVMRIDGTEFDPGLPVLWMSEGRPLP